MKMVDSGLIVAAAGVALAVFLWQKPVMSIRLIGRRRLWSLSRLPGRSDSLPSQLRIVLGVGVGLVIWVWAQLDWLGLVVGGIAGLGTVIGLAFVPSSGSTRRQEQIVAELPQVCDLLAVCTEAGIPLRAAVRVIVEVLTGPLIEVLGRVVARVDIGIPERDAWQEAGQEPGMAALGREICRCLDSGTPVSGTLRRLAVEVRRAAASSQEVRAKRVGVRCVLPLMLCFLPSFVLLGVVPIIGGVVASLFF